MQKTSKIQAKVQILNNFKINNTLTDDPNLISNAFNIFFVKKIEGFKANNDPNLITNPLTKLQEKMKNNKNTFELKTINKKSLKTVIKQLKSKTSSGKDGLSQKQLKAGVTSLVGPLQNILFLCLRLKQTPI